MAIDRYDFVCASVSGLRGDACAALAHRWDADAPFSARRVESWVLHLAPDARPARVAPQLERGRAAWFTRLWRAPSGRLYVTDASGVLHVREPDDPDAPLPPHERWREVAFPAALMGVWGLDDACIFVWGGVRERDHLFRWDGREWRELPSPGGVVALHGLAPELVYAVGRGGLVARWNGHRWDSFTPPTQETLSGVVVADAETVFACGQRGSLLEGSPWGWQEVTRHAGPLHAVAWWDDRLWLAAGRGGLLRREGRGATLEPVGGRITAASIDGREQLLVAGGASVYASTDGATFHPVGAHALTRARAGTTPLWEAP